MTDQSYTVTANNSGITFPKGNQCTLLRSQPEAACRVEVHIAESMAVGEYQLMVSENAGSTLPLPEAVVYKTLNVTNPQFNRLAVGNWHVCSITSTGNAYCWGSSYDDYGTLGNSEASSSRVPLLVNMPPNVSFTNIDSGSYHVCALSNTDNTYCWGYNSDGQLGNTTTIHANIPTAVSMPVDVRFISISVGDYHSCALGSDNKAYCWGRNGSGELGNNSTINSNVPTPVSMPTNVKFTSISSGFGNSCALGTDDKAYCWGSNQYGGLGVNSLYFISSWVPTVVSMPTNVKFTSISVGAHYSCALGTDDKAYCWGYNKYGQLGDGSTINKGLPTMVKLPENMAFINIFAGSYRSCGIANNGQSYCWGNAYLGDGTNNSSSIPVAVKMPE